MTRMKAILTNPRAEWMLFALWVALSAVTWVL